MIGLTVSLEQEGHVQQLQRAGDEHETRHDEVGQLTRLGRVDQLRGVSKGGEMEGGGGGMGLGR